MLIYFKNMIYFVVKFQKRQGLIDYFQFIFLSLSKKNYPFNKVHIMLKPFWINNNYPFKKVQKDPVQNNGSKEK